MISRSFLKSSIIFTAGGALPMLASFLLLPFYTNFLSEIDYTRLLFYISVSAISQILFSFATDTYFGIRYSQLFEEPTRQKRFIKTTSLVLIGIGTFVTLATMFTGPALFRLIFREEIGMSFWPYGFLSVLTGFLNSYFKTASICLIYVKQPGRFFIDNLINFVLTVGISVAGLYIYPDTLIGPIVGRFASGIIIFLLGLKIFNREGEGDFDRSFLPDILRFCLPYLSYGIFVWILSGVDRYILQSHVQLTELNAYDLVLKCFIGIEFLQNSLSAVIFPKVYELWARNTSNSTTEESNRYFNVFTIVNIVQLILFCIFLPVLYEILIKQQYFHHGEKFVGILAAGYACRSIVNFYLSAILFTRSTGLMLRIFGISALFQIVAAYSGVRQFGIEGALYASVFTKIVQGGLFMAYAPKVFNFRFNRFKILVLPAIYIIINILQFALSGNYSYTFFLTQLAGFGILIYILFRKEIGKVFTGVRAGR